MIEQLHALLVRDLKAFGREIEAFPSDDLLWQALPGMANPAGNLALHVAGNLRHFIGAVLGGSGYLRDRPAEFSRRAGTRAEVLRELGLALEAVEGVLPGLSKELLRREYPVEIDGARHPTGAFLLRLSAHLAYHLGQANATRRGLASA